MVKGWVSLWGALPGPVETVGPKPNDGAVSQNSSDQSCLQIVRSTESLLHTYMHYQNTLAIAAYS